MLTHSCRNVAGRYSMYILLGDPLVCPPLSGSAARGAKREVRKRTMIYRLLQAIIILSKGYIDRLIAFFLGSMLFFFVVL